ncbi:MAG: L-threonine 3-dehydrogenase [Oligoflexales bacterium]
MKALVKKDPKPGLWMEQIKRPTIGPDEVLIKINKTAICGTDLHIYNWDDWASKVVPTPLVIGHEFVGNVVELGSTVKGLKEGDRVSGEGHITCSHCRNCRAGKRHLCRNTLGVGVNRQGAFAEYLVLPAVNAFKIDPSIPDEIASIFDPYGNAVHTALSFDLVGEDVLITGAGPIGIMAVAIARHVGARHIVITDVNDKRLDIARKMGASRVVNPIKQSLSRTMADLGMDEGFDVGMEMSGNALAFTSMIDVLNHGSRIALLGIFPGKVAIDWSSIVFKGLILKGIYGREMYETWYKMASMLQSGLDISKVITHRFQVDEFDKGFGILNRGDAAKVVLDWT